MKLSQAHPIIIESLFKTGADRLIVGLGVDPCFSIRSVIIAEEAVLQSEGVHDIKVFPYDDSRSPQLARLHPKATAGQTDVLGSPGQ